MPARILVLGASTQPGSPTALLAGEAARLLSVSDAVITLVSLADYPLPLFDPDAGAAQGFPQNAVLLAHRIAIQDGLLLVVPQVDACLPALVKNVLEWTSRLRTVSDRAARPYAGLVTALASAGGEGGGREGLAATRLVLQSLGAEILTRRCHVDAPTVAFDPAGALVEAAAKADLEALIESLLDHSRALGRHV